MRPLTIKLNTGGKDIFIHLEAKKYEVTHDHEGVIIEIDCTPESVEELRQT